MGDPPDTVSPAQALDNLFAALGGRKLSTARAPTRRARSSLVGAVRFAVRDDGSDQAGYRIIRHSRANPTAVRSPTRALCVRHHLVGAARSAAAGAGRRGDGPHRVRAISGAEGGIGGFVRPSRLLPWPNGGVVARTSAGRPNRGQNEALYPWRYAAYKASIASWISPRWFSRLPATAPFSLRRDRARGRGAPGGAPAAMRENEWEVSRPLREPHARCQGGAGDRH
jgi:hypothetical protein